MKTSESIKNISTALLAAQKAMGNAVKGVANPFFKRKYADLNAIREATIPALNENGITVLQVPNGTTVNTTLLHESGEYITSEIDIVCAKPNDPQSYGSAVSYARRYSLQSLLCVGAEDDDAETATTRPEKVKVPPKARKKTTEVSEDEF
jgi:hypothetical protein